MQLYCRSLETISRGSSVYIKNILTSYIGPSYVPIVLAVTIGQKQDLSPEIKNLYSNLGILHILAVSGLHVGIFALVLSSILHKITYIANNIYECTKQISYYAIFPFLRKVPILNKHTFGSIAPEFCLQAYNHSIIKSSIIPIILLFAIWFYALIVGLSASIVRSAIMFSVFQISSMFKRKGNLYSSLSLSAILMLLINPLVIHDVGFQLSFLAVLSIVYFYPKLKACLATPFLLNTNDNFAISQFTLSNGVYKNVVVLFKRILGYLWDIALVSISAQILTLPILAYYFKKFSIYFIFANCIMIPVAFWIISLTLVLICVNPIPSIANIAGFMIGKIVYISTAMLGHISRWPYAETYISFDIVDIFGYYNILLMFVLLLKFKKFVYLILLNMAVLFYTIIKTATLLM